MTYSTGPWAHPPRRHETRAPHGAGFGLAIILSVAFWAAIAGAIFATRVF